MLDGGTPAAPHRGPPPVLDLAKATPLAFDLGWTMAVLEDLATGPRSVAEQTQPLPSEHELLPADRAHLELVRLDGLASDLSLVMPGHLDDVPVDDIANLRTVWTSVAPDWDWLGKQIPERHMQVLASLASADHSLVLSYQLGRSLRDTVSSPKGSPVEASGALEADVDANPEPADPSGLLLQRFNDARVGELQQWLSVLTPSLPPNSGAVVRASLGRWSTFVTTVLGQGTPGRVRRGTLGWSGWTKGESASSIASRSLVNLQHQGDVWLNLLTGCESTTGLLTPEAQVAAGEAALGRTVRIVRRVLVHYWFAFVILLAAMVGVLVASARFLGGAGRVWTDIAAVAGSLGAAVRGIATRVERFSEDAERPIYQAEQIDGMAWTVTNLPRVRLDHRGVRMLRRSGIQRSGVRGRA
jgi:hypothetical protein